MLLRFQRQVSSLILDMLLTNFLKIHGLLTDHFISDNARQRLLREVASRTQKAVFDVVYSW